MWHTVLLEACRHFDKDQKIHVHARYGDGEAIFNMEPLVDQIATFGKSYASC
jgi:hypothetical protein